MAVCDKEMIATRRPNQVGALLFHMTHKLGGKRWCGSDLGVVGRDLPPQIQRILAFLVDLAEHQLRSAGNLDSADTW